jgi:phage-related protein/predicted XRE-type DNA-binding protein
MGGSREDVRRFPETAQDFLGFELYRVQCGFDPKDWKPMAGIGTGVKEIRARDEAGIFRMIYLATRPEGVYVLHCYQKKTQRTSRSDLELRRSDLSPLQGEVMRVKKVADSEHDPRHVTPAGRSVFYDLFPAEKAAEMEMRAQLLMGLEQWLEKSRMTQAEAAKVLGVTQARVSDLKRGKIDRFSMDLLVRLAARAGLKPKLKLAA